MLAREELAEWRGIDRPPTSEDFPFGPDDTRACAIEGRVEPLPVGPNTGVCMQLDDSVVFGQWLELEARPILVGWGYGDDAAQGTIEAQLRSGTLSWTPLPDLMTLSSGELVLMHSSSSGTEVVEHDAFGAGDAPIGIGDALPIRLEPGVHRVEWLHLGGDLEQDDYECVLCRWVRVR